MTSQVSPELTNLTPLIASLDASRIKQNKKVVFYGEVIDRMTAGTYTIQSLNPNFANI